MQDGDVLPRRTMARACGPVRMLAIVLAEHEVAVRLHSSKALVLRKLSTVCRVDPVGKSEIRAGIDSIGGVIEHEVAIALHHGKVESIGRNQAILGIEFFPAEQEGAPGDSVGSSD